MNEYYALMDNSNVNLAAAYAILENNGESIFFRTFDDVLKIAYRVKIVEELIKYEEETEEKNNVVKTVEWLKASARKNLRENKSFYSSVIATRLANRGEYEKIYSRAKEAIESEDEHEFYAWIFLINNVT